MIASLQAATASDAPILLVTSASSGHGIGSSLDDQIDRASLIAAFELAQLGAQ
jgi:prolyl oligopeptidase